MRPKFLFFENGQALGWPWANAIFNEIYCSLVLAGLLIVAYEIRSVVTSLARVRSVRPSVENLHVLRPL